MKIKEISIIGFRKHLNKKIVFDDLETSIFIGGNNTGKTSIVEAIDYIVNSKEFSLHDFYQSSKAFDTFFSSYLEQNFEGSEDCALEYIVNNAPKIEIMVTLKQEGNDREYYADVLSKLMDYIDSTNCIVIKYKYSLANKARAVFNDLNALEGTEGIDANGFVKRFYEKERSVITDDEETTISEISRDFKFSNLIDINILKANLSVDNYSKRSKIDKQIASIVNNIINKNSDIKERTSNALNTFIETSQSAYSGEFGDKVINVFKSFGFDDSKSGELMIDIDIKFEDLLSENLSVLFQVNEDYILPEKFNGLGYNNLLYTLVEIYDFISKVVSNDKPVMIMCIEEPETHMHPEMESNFIMKINDLIQLYIDTVSEASREEQKEKLNASLQFIITTHSTSIVSNASSKSLTFITEDNCINYSSFSNDDKFALQYLTLEKVEAVFSDRVILVEGDVERILIPHFIRKSNYDHKLYSVVQINGTHFQKFIDFYSKIGRKVLVITDCDIKDERQSNPENYDKNEERWATSWRSKELVSTNDFLTSYFSVDKSDILSIVNGNINDLNSTENNVFVITQRVLKLKNNNDSVLIGRTFEEQFILENHTLDNILNRGYSSIENYKDYFDGEVNGIYNCAYGIYRYIDRSQKKLAFTFDILEEIDKVNTPLYIKEGLDWLMN